MSFSIKEYHYPIIGFISRGAEEAKYILNLTANKNSTVLQEFVNSVNLHVIKGLPYEEGEDKLMPWLSEGEETPKK
jgi:hypothetical protein